MFATTLLVGVNSGKKRALLPLLFVGREDGTVSISEEAFEWAIRIVGLDGGMPSRLAPAVGECVRVLARFVNFLGSAFDENGLAASEVDYAVTAYALLRHNGTTSADTPQRLRDLMWAPASSTTVRREFEILRKFVEFCTGEFRYAWPMTTKSSVGELELPISRLRDLEKDNDRDFFAHLSARRAYWEKEKGRQPLELPRHLFRPTAQNVAKPPPEADAVHAIIRAETNPCFRAIFIAAAFGGLRISEQLNSWQVDHRPGVDRALFFGPGAAPPALDPLPLYIRAHPSESTYISHPQKLGTTRKTFLETTYGLKPRNHL